VVGHLKPMANGVGSMHLKLIVVVSVAKTMESSGGHSTTIGDITEGKVTMMTVVLLTLNVDITPV
jgi:hypothetical protein